MSERIFILEDDAPLREGLCALMQKEGYSVESASSVSAAQKVLAEQVFSLIILDVMLPDGSGFDVCTKLRNSAVTTPILFLTACDDEFQIVHGLDCGADDYVTKPFRLLELMSRVRALLRRQNNASIYKSRGITLDINNMTVKKDGENIFVTPTEFQLLSILIRNSGVIVTRSTLLKNIWDDNNNFIDDNTLSVHISRLREKIGAGSIVTVRGVGYRWEEKR